MLEVKQSNIEGAGLGVFATKDIDENTLLTEYYGFIYNDLSAPTDQSSAVLYLDGYTTIGDTSTHASSQCGQMINDYIRITYSSTLTPSNLVNAVQNYELESSKRANTAPVAQSSKHYVKSITCINQGEELYMSYGSHYWLHLLSQHNSLTPKLIESINSLVRDQLKTLHLINSVHQFKKQQE